MGRCI